MKDEEYSKTHMSRCVFALEAFVEGLSFECIEKFLRTFALISFDLV